MTQAELHDEAEVDSESNDPTDGRKHEVVDALFNEVLAGVPRKEMVTVTPRTTIADAIRAMNQRHVGCAVVVENDELVGIFTERDVLTRVATAKIDVDTTPVESVMTRDPDTLPPTASVAFALRQMTQEGYRHIPLMDGARRPVGVVAVRDVVAWLCELFPASVLNLPPNPSFPTSEDGG